jgi:hypothetical protein
MHEPHAPALRYRIQQAEEFVEFGLTPHKHRWSSFSAHPRDGSNLASVDRSVGPRAVPGAGERRPPP